MTFWVVAAVLTICITFFIVGPLMRGEKTADQPLENLDIQVYRDQLDEVESDLAKGVLSNDEAERTRLEVSRRILEADATQSDVKVDGNASKPMRMAGIVAASVALLVGTGAIYWSLGAKGTRDFPLSKRNAQMAEAQAARPPQAEVEARLGDLDGFAEPADESYQELVAELRKTVAQRPDDLRGHELLANHEARLGNFAAARIAKGRAIELKKSDSTAADFTDWAELMIIAAGGYVSPLAEKALSQAIRLDSKNPRALYYSGLDLAQNGRPDLAMQIWTALLEQGPPDAPWINPIREQIGDVARLAGQAPPELPGLPGPDAAQIEGAENMSPEDRQAMIQGMVQQLSARLATEGGTASEWARLIRAYGVLGETDRATLIWQESQSVFAADPIAIQELLSAAQAAGIAE